MDLKDRTLAIAESVKNRRIEDRHDRMERDLERLRVENETLRDEIDPDRDRLLKVLGSLEKQTAKKGRKPHRLRRLFTLSAAAGGAYVVGAKAGHERYEQIRRWWGNVRDRSPVSDASAAADQWIDKTAQAVNAAGSRASEVVQDASGKATAKIEEATTPPTKRNAL
jgi:hypothetical protein